MTDCRNNRKSPCQPLQRKSGRGTQAEWRREGVAGERKNGWGLAQLNNIKIIFQAEPPPAITHPSIHPLHTPKTAGIIEKRLPPPPHKGGRNRSGGAPRQSRGKRGRQEK